VISRDVKEWHLEAVYKPIKLLPLGIEDLDILRVSFDKVPHAHHEFGLQ